MKSERTIYSWKDVSERIFKLSYKLKTLINQNQNKIEKNDMSPIETALREANEEVGLRSDDVNVLGNLDVYITGTGFRIMPIVSIVSDYSYLKANQNEVDEIFFLPLEFLMDSNNHKKESATYEVNNKKYEYDYYVLPYKDYNIWGATAGMLINLYQILK